MMGPGVGMEAETRHLLARHMDSAQHYRHRVMNVLVAVLTLFVFNDAAWLAPGLRGDLPPWGPVAPPPWSAPPPSAVFRRPMDAMVDLTNDLGVAILQEYSHSRSNFAFSPYGLASVLVVLYEGAKGESARQIHVAGRFPWDRDITRIGFRDIHRHLRSYFSHEGYLSGITLNKDKSSLNSEYKRVLRYYGYDVDLDSQKPSTQRPMQQIPVVTRTPKPKESTTLETPGRENDVVIQSFDKTTVKSPEKDVTTKPSTTVTTKLSTLGFFEPTTVKNFTVETSTVSTQALNETQTVSEKALPSTTVTTAVSPQETKTTTVTTQTVTPKETPTTPVTTAIPETVTRKETTPVTTPVTPIVTTATTRTNSVTQTVSPKETVTEVMTTLSIPAEDRIDLEVTEEIESTSTILSRTTLPSTVDNFVTTVATEVETVRSVEITDGTVTTTTITPETTRMTLTDVSSSPDMTTFSNLVVSDGVTRVPDEVKPVTTTVFPTTASTVIPEKNYFSGTSTFSPETTVETDATTQDGVEETTISGVVDNGMLVPQPAAKENDEPVTLENQGLEIIRKRSPDVVDIRTLDEYMLASKPVQAPVWETFFGADEKFLPKTVDEFLMYKDELSNFVPRTLDELLLGGPVVQFGTSVAFKRFRSRRRRTIADILHLPTVPDLSLQLQNGMFDSHVSRKAELYRPLPRQEFLVDAVSETPVPVMTYTNVFPFAYIPRLHSTALEFPLDDERYKLLIILPMERRGLRQLTYDLSAVTLRGVMDALRPSRVRATVPTFMVEGFVILTPALQRLGIWDVFEPRRANLSGMSSDPELYVRNVEQSVTVVIRNYVEILDIQTRTMAARGVEHEFIATHPFLYFVLDTETNVSLMAGQMLDPLNSRVY